MDTEKFEKYLINKQKFIIEMRSINKDDFVDYCYSIQLEVLNDIIHHFNVLVKGETSSGLGVVNEE